MDRIRRDGEQRQPYSPDQDIPEPFISCNVELRLDHPYRRSYQCSVCGPVFNDRYPSIAD